MLSRKNQGRFTWKGWHAFREAARKGEWTAEVFSEIEKTRYDLVVTTGYNDGQYGEAAYGENIVDTPEDVNNSTAITSDARITGEDHEELGLEENYSDRIDEKNVIDENPRRA